jgi:signal transduction histidine kinase
METQQSTSANAEKQGPEVARIQAELRAMEDRFRSIIQKTADGIVVVGDDGVIRFANRAAGELFDREPDALAGSPFGHPLVVGETTEIDIVRRGEPRVAELRVMDTEWEGAAARIVSLRDVTDRKNAEAQARQLVREQVRRAEAEEAAGRAEFLDEAGRRLSSSLDFPETIRTAASLAVEHFADYCVIDVLAGDEVQRFAEGREGTDVERLAGEAEAFPLDPASDSPLALVLRDREPLLVRHVDEEWLRSATVSEEHYRLVAALRPRSLVAVPLDTGHDTLGVLTAVCTRPDESFQSRHLHLARELGRRAAMAVENARLYQEAQAASRAKSDFLSVMSHELRTPLSAIIGYTDLMDRGVAGEVTEDQSDYLDRIRSSSNHLLHIIEEILAFASTEAGEAKVQVEDTTMGDLLEGVRAVADPLVNERSLDFVVEIDDPAREMRIDVRKVRQILLNLISNAVKFTREGSITLRAGVEDGMAVFVVADTGVGIPAHRQEAIFERFSQVQDAMTREVGGTGLGLTVARSFARLMGGDIVVESEVGAGSTFTVRFPAHPDG